MQSIWREAPIERPNFQQLVYSFAKLIGEDISHEYFILEGPQRDEVSAEPYDLVTFHNNACSTTLSLSPPVEYEVPISSQPRTPSAALCSSVPDPEPLTVLSGTPPNYDEITNNSRAMREQAKLRNSTNGVPPVSSTPPIYHTLEQPVVM